VSSGGRESRTPALIMIGVVLLDGKGDGTYSVVGEAVLEFSAAAAAA